MTDSPKHKLTSLEISRRLLEQVRPYWAYLLGALLLDLLATPVALLKPLPLKLAVDSVLGSHPLPGFLLEIVPASWQSTSVAILYLATGLILVVTLLNSAQYMSAYFLKTYAGEKLVLDFRACLFRHAQRLSLSFHDRRGATDTTYRIQQDASAAQNITIYGWVPLLQAWVTLLVMLVVIALLDWTLALVALGVCPALFYLIRRFGPILRKGWAEVKKLDSAAMAVVQEALSSARLVKAFSREDREARRFVDHSDQRIKGHIRVTLQQARFDVLVSLSMAAGTATVLFLGVRHVQTGLLTLGELLMVMAYLGQLYSPLNTISKKLTDLQSGMASAERAFVLLDENPEVIEKPDALPLRTAKGQVAFEDVCFSYREDLPVLRHIHLAVAPGSRVGIQGKTGAGKSTLMGLLMRFYDVDSGRILVDGVDIRNYRLKDLRAQFGLVLQDPVLFSTSIGENIAYGRPSASFEEIREAARAANAHSFISELPRGYETEVGDRGMQLSGGERQRISLARAFLKGAPILILDEPTSAVDVGTESDIMDAITELTKGRTTFIIAHRLSTLDHCDRRVELSHGEMSLLGEEHLRDSLLNR